MTEMFDIYDEALNHIGWKPRDEVHREGEWHRVFHCWVIYRDAEGEDWVIIQKRAANKTTWPDFLDVSAAGHYEAGEAVPDGLRELEEELGLTPQFDALIPLGKRVSIARYKDIIDCQIADVFFYICDQPLSAYRYQKEEIAGLVAVNVDEALALFSGEVESINAPAAGLGVPIITISPDDFIPTHDRYFYKTLVLAKRCLNGESHLLI